jgi:hypothetical protein
VHKREVAAPRRTWPPVEEFRRASIRTGNA